MGDILETLFVPDSYGSTFTAIAAAAYPLTEVVISQAASHAGL